eukprot:Hpha_TRINITY_DN15440_c2_g1::TRINITY_DN15440_c2_g1_i1::g.174371::m.174371
MSRDQFRGGRGAPVALIRRKGSDGVASDISGETPFNVSMSSQPVLTTLADVPRQFSALSASSTQLRTNPSGQGGTSFGQRPPLPPQSALPPHEEDTPTRESSLVSHRKSPAYPTVRSQDTDGAGESPAWSPSLSSGPHTGEHRIPPENPRGVAAPPSFQSGGRGRGRGAGAGPDGRALLVLRAAFERSDMRRRGVANAGDMLRTLQQHGTRSEVRSYCAASPADLDHSEEVLSRLVQDGKASVGWEEVRRCAEAAPPQESHVSPGGMEAASEEDSDGGWWDTELAGQWLRAGSPPAGERDLHEEEGRNMHREKTAPALSRGHAEATEPLPRLVKRSASPRSHPSEGSGGFSLAAATLLLRVADDESAGRRIREQAETAGAEAIKADRERAAAKLPGHRLRSAAVNLQVEPGRMLLAVAVLGCEGLVREAARMGAGLNAALLAAAQFSSGAGVLRELVAAGARPEEGDPHGWTAMHYAVQRDNAAALRALLQSTPSHESQAALASVRAPGTGETPLHLALRGQSTQCIEILVDCGAELVSYGTAGETPAALLLGVEEGAELLTRRLRAGGLAADRLRRHLCTFLRKGTNLSSTQQSTLDALKAAGLLDEPPMERRASSPYPSSVGGGVDEDVPKAVLRISLGVPYESFSATEAISTIASQLDVSEDWFELISASGGEETQMRIRLRNCGPSADALQWQLARCCQNPTDPLTRGLGVTACTVEVPRTAGSRAASERAVIREARQLARELLAELPSPPAEASSPRALPAEVVLVKPASGRMGLVWETCGETLVLVGVELGSCAQLCGFSDLIGRRLMAVDGSPIRNLTELASAAEGRSTIRLRFADDAVPRRLEEALACAAQSASQVATACAEAEAEQSGPSLSTPAVVLGRCAAVVRELSAALRDVERSGVNVASALTLAVQLNSLCVPFVGCVAPAVPLDSPLPGMTPPSVLHSAATRRMSPSMPVTPRPTPCFGVFGSPRLVSPQVGHVDLLSVYQTLNKEFGGLQHAFTELSDSRTGMVNVSQLRSALAQGDCDVRAEKVLEALGATGDSLTQQQLFSLQRIDPDSAPSAAPRLSPKPKQSPTQSPPGRMWQASKRSVSAGSGEASWAASSRGLITTARERATRLAKSVLRRHGEDSVLSLSGWQSALRDSGAHPGASVTAEEVCGHGGPYTMDDVVKLILSDAALCARLWRPPPGTHVNVSGLSSRSTEYNGRCGEVKRCRGDGVIEVQIPHAFQCHNLKQREGEQPAPVTIPVRLPNVDWSPGHDNVIVNKDAKANLGITLRKHRTWWELQSVATGSPAAAAGLERFVGRRALKGSVVCWEKGPAELRDLLKGEKTTVSAVGATQVVMFFRDPPWTMPKVGSSVIIMGAAAGEGVDGLEGVVSEISDPRKGLVRVTAPGGGSQPGTAAEVAAEFCIPSSEDTE